MRLVISRGRFTLEDVPRAFDLSDLQRARGVSWFVRLRRLTWSTDDAEWVREELTRRGVRLADHEVRAAVASALEDDPINGPARIAAFGDARAVPELSRALDAYEPRLDCVICDYLAVHGLGTAIEALGGAPSEAQRRKIAEYEQRQRGAWPDEGEFVRTTLALVPPLPVTPPPARRRLGRNQPCHCGSGRKYKSCHLALDQATPAVTRR